MSYSGNIGDMWGIELGYAPNVDVNQITEADVYHSIFIAPQRIACPFSLLTYYRYYRIHVAHMSCIISKPVGFVRGLSTHVGLGFFKCFFTHE